MKRFPTLIATLILCALPAHAQNAPKLAFPVECTLGENCWTVNYVDTDPAPGSARDFTCGERTYDDHQGTDFALPSRAPMKQGVNVLAAADGKVLRTRDGDDDSVKTTEQYDTIRANNRECGNGVILDHGNGFLTYYCHLKQGSISVKQGDEIKEGDPIAKVGQSGLAEFPHLHLTVIWEEGHIDPFTGHLKEDGCGKFKNNLWKDNLTYTPLALYDAGFRSKVPDWKAIEEGETNPANLSPASETLTFWFAFYGAIEGDKIAISIIDPDGKTFADYNGTQDKTRARQYYFTGRKTTSNPLKTGTYTGTATVSRIAANGEAISRTITRSIEIR